MPNGRHDRSSYDGSFLDRMQEKHRKEEITQMLDQDLASVSALPLDSAYKGRLMQVIIVFRGIYAQS